MTSAQPSSYFEIWSGFCAGTKILTSLGPVPVEKLEIGTVAVTAFGRFQRVIHMRRYCYASRSAPGHCQILPIRVAAGTLGHAVPSRDLYLAPEQALYIAGCLVPIAGLINGCSIRQVKNQQNCASRDPFYFQIELEGHDVLLAEGAPAESYMSDPTGKNRNTRAGWI